jgi:hypothetical protein
MLIYEKYREKFDPSDGTPVKPVTLYRLIASETTSPENGRILVRSFRTMGYPCFSPDASHIGYAIEGGLHDLELWISAVETAGPGFRVDRGTSIRFAWSEDGTRLYYAKAAGDSTHFDDVMLGSICERQVLDHEGNFIMAGQKELAGILFSPFLKIEYGPGGRIFFSSARLSLPASKLDDPQWTLFCYDPLTETVSGILPTAADVFSAKDLTVFAFSPDGRKILLPQGEDNIFIYNMNTRDFGIVRGESLDQKEDWPKMVPAWKGNEAFSAAYKSGSPDDPNVYYGVFNLKGELIVRIR